MDAIDNEHAIGTIVTHEFDPKLRFKVIEGNVLKSLCTGLTWYIDTDTAKHLQVAPPLKTAIKTVHGYRNNQLNMINELATRSFESHVVHIEHADGLYRHYRCQTPKTYVYCFHVVTTPGQLFVYGDIGNFAFQREEDMIAFARKAINDVDYFAGKAWSTMPTKRWSDELAMVWVEQERAELVEQLLFDDYPQDLRGTFDERLTRINDKYTTLREAAEDSESQFALAWRNLDGYTGEDWPNLLDWSPSYLWSYEAIRWLLGRLK